MVLVEQSKVVTRSCRAVSAELIRRVKCCRKDMQRFIVPMEKSSLVERRPARQRHGIKCQPHKKCQIANNEVAYLERSIVFITFIYFLAEPHRRTISKGGGQNKSDGWCAAGRWGGIKAGLGRAAGQYGEVSLLPIQQHRISR